MFVGSMFIHQLGIEPNHPRFIPVALGFLWTIRVALGYYNSYKCFGSGDCIITTGYMGGGFIDEHHRWLIECQDGEGMIGIFDLTKQFVGISHVWCKFSFPNKPPARGFYPYFPWCNVRNFSQSEFYCYDKMWPQHTTDTFVTVLGRTPPGYKLDYTRCQWKYTHDKAGEHYDGFWIVLCDTGHVMSGMGWSMNPWDTQMHFTWIQCCPVVDVPGVVDITHQLV